jgi:hypothetical protein
MSLADDYKNYPIVLLIEREKLNKYHDFFEHFLFFVLVIFFFFFFFLRQGLALQLRLTWNSLCNPDCPQTLDPPASAY